MDTKLEQYVESFAGEKRYSQLSDEAFENLREDLIAQAMHWFDALVGDGLISDAVSNKLSRYTVPYSVNLAFRGQLRHNKVTEELLNHAIFNSTVEQPEALARYGDEGISIQRTELEDGLKASEQLIMMTPSLWLVTEEMREAFQAYAQITTKAKARFKLDHGEDLHFVDIYLLSGMNYKSVRNATQEKHGAGRLKVEANNTVENENAVQWLLNRKGFRPTPGSQYAYEQKPSQSEDYYVFIPVDEDGTALRPSEITNPPSFSHNVYELIIDGVQHFETKIESVLELIKEGDEIKWVSEPGIIKHASYWQRVRRIDLIREEEEELRKNIEKFEEENHDVMQWAYGKNS